MNSVPLAEPSIAKRVNSLLGQVANKRGDDDELALPDFLFLDYGGEPYPVWQEAVRVADRKYANMSSARDSAAGVKLCQLLASQFNTEEGWRGMLNRLAEIQLRSSVAGVAKLRRRRAGRKENGEDLRTHFGSLSATASALGAPDAEALVRSMMADAGIDIEE